jgi:L-threonylcarbamoyladenylate synthase
MQIRHPTPDVLHEAVQLLRGGALVAFATETVYGLGAHAGDDRAVAEIFSVKGRPQFNPLIVHVRDAAMAKELVEWNALAERLSQAFWPGPLTLILPSAVRSPVSLLASAGGDTLAVRMPSHPVAQALLSAAGFPIAAPSANRSGRISPTTAAHVQEELGHRIGLILDGGNAQIGIESTVLDVRGREPVLLRPGSVTREQLEVLLQCDIGAPGRAQGQVSPGMLASHYAPSIRVRLNVTQPLPGEALLAFGPQVPEGARATINLSERGDPGEAAARLFAAMRTLDKPHYSAMAVMPIPMQGLGIAINDRLTRAAEPEVRT